MKLLLMNALLLGLTMPAPLSAQTKSAANPVVPYAHVRNSFDLTVRLPYESAAPLFGPNGERGWSEGHWDPQFLYPLPGEDVQGAVFTVQHGAHKVFWVNTTFDLKARHFQYVYFVPEIVATVIDVNFVPLGATSTKVIVVYERTALNAEANETVAALGKHDAANGPEWQKSIEDYLARSKDRDK